MLTGGGRRTLTFKSSKGIGDGIEEDCLVSEARLCQLTRTTLLIHRTSSELGSSPVPSRPSLDSSSSNAAASSSTTSAISTSHLPSASSLFLELKLSENLRISAHVDLLLLEISGDTNSKLTFFFGFDNAERLEKWRSAISLRIVNIQNLAAQIREKRQRVLGMPTVAPVTMRPINIQRKTSKVQQSQKGFSKPSSPKGKDVTSTFLPPPSKLTELAKEGYDAVATPVAPPLISKSLAAQGYRGMESLSNLASVAGYGGFALQEKYGAKAQLNVGYGMTALDFGAQAEVDDSKAAVALSLPELSSSESSDDEDFSSGGRDDFNEVFQRCVTELRNLEAASSVVSDPELERKRTETYVELIGMAEDFVASAVRYGQIIVSEVYLPLHRKTIKPDKTVGGVIGGEKYIVQNILFKVRKKRVGKIVQQLMLHSVCS